MRKIKEDIYEHEGLVLKAVSDYDCTKCPYTGKCDDKSFECNKIIKGKTFVMARLGFDYELKDLDQSINFKCAVLNKQRSTALQKALFDKNGSWVGGSRAILGDRLHAFLICEKSELRWLPLQDYDIFLDSKATELSFDCAVAYLNDKSTVKEEINTKTKADAAHEEDWLCEDVEVKCDMAYRHTEANLGEKHWKVYQHLLAGFKVLRDDKLNNITEILTRDKIEQRHGCLCHIMSYGADDLKILI